MSINLLKIILEEELAKLDYKLLPKKQRISDMIYSKELDNGMILSLGITKSKIYNHRFTGSYYLAASYTWSMASPIFLPENVYERIGNYITLSERKNLVDKLFWNLTDVWWLYNDSKKILNFVEAVRITQRKFISQGQNILPNLLNPNKYLDYKNYISALNEILKNIDILNNDVPNFLNDESLYEITKKILAKRNDIRNNKNGISLMSVDAYNCFYLSSKKNRDLIASIANQITL